MPRREDLPPELRTGPFSVSRGRDSGLTPDRLRASDLQKPFHGVRSVGLSLERVVDRCRAYSARMPASAAFSHATAAEIWGFPLPLQFAADAIHIVVPVGTRAPRGKAVRGHQSRSADDTRLRGGLRVTSPAMTWCDLADVLELPDLIACAEFVITGNPYENRLPLASLDQLVAAARSVTGSHGHRARMAALNFAREGALSRPESLLRYLLVSSGIPDPRVNEYCNDARGSFIALADLSWPEFRVAVEYEGDHHRGVSQFRSDIHRFEKLADHNWAAVRISADDLFDRPAETVARVASRLTARGWTGTARYDGIRFAR